MDQSFGRELHHLPSDPQQMNNLFAKDKDIAKKLQASYTKMLKALGVNEEYLKYWRDL